MLTLVLAFQINYKVKSIIQIFYPLSNYLLQPSCLQTPSDPGEPLGMSHSQTLDLHHHSLPRMVTTFGRLCALQEPVTKGSRQEACKHKPK